MCGPGPPRPNSKLLKEKVQRCQRLHGRGHRPLGLSTAAYSLQRCRGRRPLRRPGGGRPGCVRAAERERRRRGAVSSGTAAAAIAGQRWSLAGSWRGRSGSGRRSGSELWTFLQPQSLHWLPRTSEVFTSFNSATGRTPRQVLQNWTAGSVSAAGRLAQVEG